MSIGNRPDLNFDVKKGVKFHNFEIKKGIFIMGTTVRIWIRGGSILTGEVVELSDDKIHLKVGLFEKPISIFYRDIWHSERKIHGELSNLEADFPYKPGDEKFEKFKGGDYFYLCLKIEAGGCVFCGFSSYEDDCEKGVNINLDVPFIKGSNGTLAIPFEKIDSVDMMDGFTMTIPETVEMVREMRKESRISNEMTIMRNDSITGFCYGIRKQQKGTEYYIIYRDTCILVGSFSLPNDEDEEYNVKLAGNLMYNFFITLSVIYKVDENSLKRSNN